MLKLRCPRKSLISLEATPYYHCVSHCLREDKRGAIDEQLPPILKRLQIDPRHGLYLNRNFESRFKSLVGAAHSIRSACEQLGKRWAQGIRGCEC